MPYQKQRERDLADEALHALHDKTGLDGRVVEMHPRVAPGYEADAIVELVVDGQRRVYIVECKSHVDRKSTLQQVANQLRGLREPSMLIAPYISRELAEFSREIGLQFADTHGNAYLKSPGIYVYVAGEKNSTGKEAIRPVKGVSSTSLRIIFGLLSKPGLVNASYREIAQCAGVSLGAVSATFDDLKNRGHLIDGKNRALIEPRRLFDEWVTNYAIVLRPRLQHRRFSAPDRNWWETLSLVDLHAVWGGEVAAARMTSYLKPAAQTLYVDPANMHSDLKHLITRYRLKPDPAGPIEIMEKFWNFEPAMAPDLAPPILVYADLIATIEPRNIETAQLIKERIIDKTFHQS